MSYYEKRIADLEARVAQLAREQRLKAIPVEAQLLDRIKELKAEVERLRKVGDEMATLFGGDYSDNDGVCYDRKWNAAKEGKV